MAWWHTRFDRHHPFSIHKRIEVGETKLVGADVKKLEDFQYPQTDRGG